jgi:hypothetical protein
VRRVGWGVLLGVGSPLHGVIDFSGRGLMRRLDGILVHFLFCLQISRAIYVVVVGCATIVHAVWRFMCVTPTFCKNKNKTFCANRSTYKIIVLVKNFPKINLA